MSHTRRYFLLKEERFLQNETEDSQVTQATNKDGPAAALDVTLQKMNDAAGLEGGYDISSSDSDDGHNVAYQAFTGVTKNLTNLVTHVGGLVQGAGGRPGSGRGSQGLGGSSGTLGLASPVHGSSGTMHVDTGAGAGASARGHGNDHVVPGDVQRVRGRAARQRPRPPRVSATRQPAPT